MDYYIVTKKISQPVTCGEIDRSVENHTKQDKLGTELLISHV